MKQLPVSKNEMQLANSKLKTTVHEVPVQTGTTQTVLLSEGGGPAAKGAEFSTRSSGCALSTLQIIIVT